MSSLPTGAFPEFGGTHYFYNYIISYICEGLETSFIVESSTASQKAEPETTGKASDVDEPVVCETVCKPLGGTPAAAPSQAPNTANVKSVSFLQVDKKICHSKGGKWNHGKGAGIYTRIPALICFYFALDLCEMAFAHRCAFLFCRQLGLR